MKNLLLLFFIAALSLSLSAQDRYKYAVHFTDKDQTPYSIDRPEEFLSQKAIDRRAKYNISIIEEDLPIDPAYIQEVLATSNDVELIIQVKWHNAIIISLSDTNNINAIASLSHVAETKLVFRPDLKSSQPDKLHFEVGDEKELLTSSFTSDYDSAYYGGAWIQINQLKGNVLHQMGYTGQGITIAVLDAGFIGVDERTIFTRLWENDQIKGTSNFVSPGETVFASHSHGTSVLSTMGGFWEGSLIGTAPDADYWLLRTEDGATEFPIEEYNWVAGAAFADSVGADVLNTSLGYTTFDDPSMDHTWAELNGDSTIITRGANMAYRKGMLVVNSAGNSGSSSWRYIGAPADGYQVFSIGAIDGDQGIATFSSVGFPWSDDVKPDVVARGVRAYVANASADNVFPANGTSFSSPIMAGMSASLWQADPTLSPFMIKQAIYYSADRFNQPDTLYGYGLPNFENALGILGVDDEKSESVSFLIAPNPVQNYFQLILRDQNSEISWNLFNSSGQVVNQGKNETAGGIIPFSMENYPAGIYILDLKQGDYTEKMKITKL